MGFKTLLEWLASGAADGVALDVSNPEAMTLT
jgi:hypothetical protein